MRTTSGWHHLAEHMPPSLQANISYPTDRRPQVGLDQHLKYETGTGGIEMRSMPAVDGTPRYRVYVRYPEGDRAGMAVYESWFWKESYRYFHARAAAELRERGVDAGPRPAAGTAGRRPVGPAAGVSATCSTSMRLASNGSPAQEAVPTLEMRERAVVGGALDLRAAIATALVMFSLCFTCVYLMPSLDVRGAGAGPAAGPGPEPGVGDRDPGGQVPVLPGVRHPAGHAAGGHPQPGRARAGRSSGCRSARCRSGRWASG